MNARELEITASTGRAFSRRLIEVALTNHGPLSTSELAASLGATRFAVESALVRGRSVIPKAFHVFGWSTPGAHGGSPACLWACGDMPDVPKPTAKRHRKPVANPRPRGKQKPRLALDPQALRDLARAHDPFGRIPL